MARVKKTSKVHKTSMAKRDVAKLVRNDMSQVRLALWRLEGLARKFADSRHPDLATEFVQMQSSLEHSSLWNRVVMTPGFLSRQRKACESMSD